MLTALEKGVRTSRVARIDGRELPLDRFTVAEADRIELHRWLWTVLLGDGLRPLASAGRWDEAVARAREHGGACEFAAGEQSTGGTAERTLLLSQRAYGDGSKSGDCPGSSLATAEYPHDGHRTVPSHCEPGEELDDILGVRGCRLRGRNVHAHRQVVAVDHHFHQTGEEKVVKGQAPHPGQVDDPISGLLREPLPQSLHSLGNLLGQCFGTVGRCLFPSRTDGEMLFALGIGVQPVVPGVVIKKQDRLGAADRMVQHGFHQYDVAREVTAQTTNTVAR